MTSLWTDDDHGAHPWVAARQLPAPARGDDDEPPAPRQPLKAVAIAVACAVAALAGAVFEVLR